MPLIIGGSSGSSSALSVIQTVTLAAPAATIEVDAIPGSYQDVLIEFALRGTAVAGTVNTFLRLAVSGGAIDTSANYCYETIRATGAGAAGVAAAQTANGLYLGESPAASATAGLFGRGVAKIFGYAGTTNPKNVLSQSGAMQDNASTSSFFSASGWGCLPSTNGAVTSILIRPSSGNWDTGSVVTVSAGVLF